VNFEEDLEGKVGGQFYSTIYNFSGGTEETYGNFWGNQFLAQD
jgi:hypothetical protein